MNMGQFFPVATCLVAALTIAAPVVAQDMSGTLPCLPVPGGPPCPPAAAITNPATGGATTIGVPTSGVPTIRSPVVVQPRTNQQGSPIAVAPSQAGDMPQSEFQDFVALSVGRQLPLFGYSLFAGVPTTFAPVDSIPVTPDYVVGPGDEILIRAWG